MSGLSAEQQAAVNLRPGPVLLAATAGSGKTRVLVERIAAIVRAGEATLPQIVAITFTEKAAGELRTRVGRRLRELLADASVAGEERERVAAAVEAIDRAPIGTIHGWCARLLRTHALRAEIDPAFEQLDELAGQRVIGDAYATALEELTVDDTDAVRVAADVKLPALRSEVLDLVEALRSRGVQPVALPGAPPAPDATPLLARLCEARAAFARELTTATSTASVRRALATLERAEALLAAAGPPPATELRRLRVPRSGNALKTPSADAYDDALSAATAALDHADALPAWAFLKALVARTAKLAQERRAERGALDFTDLELRARALLDGHPEVRAAVRASTPVMLVDEFQDTNPLQLEIVDLASDGTAFVVGDGFQSIYRFRHADVARFRARQAALAGDGRALALTTSYRATPELLDLVNLTWQDVFGDGFAPMRPPDDARDDRAGAPAIELLLTCDAWGKDEDLDLGLLPRAARSRQAEARMLAQRLAALVAEGTLWDAEAGIERPIRPGDIAVLMRAATDIGLFEQALADVGLRTYVLGGRGFWERREVQDLVAYLAVLANPLDDEHCYEVLASPLCGASADALVRLGNAARDARAAVAVVLRERFGGPAERATVAAPAELGEDPEAFAPPQDEPGGDRPERAWLDGIGEDDAHRLQALAERLAADRVRAARLPLDALLEHVVLGTGYDLQLLGRPGGERRLANVRKLQRLAREVQESDAGDLRAFVDQVAVLAGEDEDERPAREGDAPIDGDGLDAVRLMTIHRSKGLEFPVVAIADLGRRRPTDVRIVQLADDVTSPGGIRAAMRLPRLGEDRAPVFGVDELRDRSKAADRAEEDRLLYVAMTRAQQRLVISGVLDLRKARQDGSPIDDLAPQVLGAEVWDGDDGPLLAHEVVVRSADGRPVRIEVWRNAPETVGDALVLPPAPDGAASSSIGRDAVGELPPLAPVPAPPPEAPSRLSYSQIGDHARCGYGFYLRRVLGLPQREPPAGVGAREEGLAEAEPAASVAAGVGDGGQLVLDLYVLAADGSLGSPAAALRSSLPGQVTGRLVHDALERLIRAGAKRGNVVPDVRALLAEVAAQPGEHEPVELGDADLDDLAGLIDAFTGSDVAARLAACERVAVEQSFAFVLPDAGPAGDLLVSGRFDAIGREPDGTLLVVDHKTDRIAPGDDLQATLGEKYATQRIVYALAALATGAERVAVVHHALRRPAEPLVLDATAADTDGLRAKLRDRVAPILSGEFIVSPDPDIDLCGRCPGRGTLCSHPEERTLRPPRWQRERAAAAG